MSDAEIEQRFRESKDAEYAEVTSRVRVLRAGYSKKRRVAEDERVDLLAKVGRLQQRTRSRSGQRFAGRAARQGDRDVVRANAYRSASHHGLWQSHTSARDTSVPLLVMDMYEHSYQMDFGAAAARYLDAFFTNIQWDEVNRRLERATHAANVLRAVAS